jgi:hypothetical protein
MGWRDKFWSAYGAVVNTAIDVTASTLNAVGSLVCIVGGVGFAIADVLDETVTAAYFGSALASGSISVEAKLKAFNLHFSETSPFQQANNKAEGLSYNVQDYLQPETVRTASGLCLGSGTALRLMGANLKLWQQGRLENANFRRRNKAPVDGPSREEYLYVSSESILGSMSYTFFTSSLTALVIDNSGLLGSHHGITYPTYGDALVNTTHYNGPVTTFSFPLKYQFAKNISFDFFGISLPASLNGNLDAVINTTYGAGLFFQSRVRTSPPIIVPGAAASVFYLVSTLFSKKAREKRDERLHNEDSDLARALMV